MKEEKTATDSNSSVHINGLEIPLEFSKETRNFFVFSKEGKKYPMMFPHNIYLDKSLFAEDKPLGIVVKFQETK